MEKNMRYYSCGLFAPQLRLVIDALTIMQYSTKSKKDRVEIESLRNLLENFYHSSPPPWVAPKPNRFDETGLFWDEYKPPQN